ncbi:Uma2 family endonuclease [Phormidesmis sp. 146-33]
MALTAQQLDDLMPDATQLDSDEPEMETSAHYDQLALLVTCLEWLWRDRDDFFIGANLTLYFSRQQLKNRDFRGPDFFLVQQTQNHPRRSWVVWEEDGRYPDLIIELLSDETANVDRGLKKNLYQDRFRTHEYFWFSPDSLEFAGFRLVSQHYQPISPNDQGLLWSEALGLYLGIHDRQLRYFTPQGDLALTAGEAAIAAVQEAQTVQRQAQEQIREAEQQAQEAQQQAQEQIREAEQQAQEAQQQAQEAQRRAERLEAQLRSLRVTRKGSLNIDPD